MCPASNDPAQGDAVEADFQRIKRLPPYVFNIVGELKMAARARGEEAVHAFARHVAVDERLRQPLRRHEGRMQLLQAEGEREGPGEGIGAHCDPRAHAPAHERKYKKKATSA